MSFRTAISRAAAPLARSTRASTSFRCISTSAVRRSDDHHQPIITGTGGKAGEVPSNFEQATGLERLELLARMEGIDLFDLKPLPSDRIGTKKDPIIVGAIVPSRIIGCSGSPAGSHDTKYLNLNTKREFHRCSECGSVYKLRHIKPEDDGAAPHHH